MKARKSLRQAIGPEKLSREHGPEGSSASIELCESLRGAVFSAFRWGFWVFGVCSKETIKRHKGISLRKCFDAKVKCCHDVESGVRMGHVCLQRLQKGLGNRFEMLGFTLDLGLLVLDLDLKGTNLGAFYKRQGLGHVTRQDMWHTYVKARGLTPQARHLGLQVFE